jgi:hypothetical protein
MKKLIELIREIPFFPKLEVNKNKREVTIKEEGIFGNNLTEAYWILKKYRIIFERDNPDYQSRPTK